MSEADAVQVELSTIFIRRVRTLQKRYRNIRQDIEPILQQLQAGQILGEQIPHVGEPVFKIRIRNRDIQKGKSAGYHLIYYLKINTKIIPLTIYSKSDQADITTQEIQDTWDDTLRLWDLQGNCIGEPFQGHQSPVMSVAFSPDGKHIISGDSNQTLQLWDLQGNCIGEPFQGHEGSISSVAFSPNGEGILSGSYDITLRLWRGATGAVGCGCVAIASGTAPTPPNSNNKLAKFAASMCGRQRNRRRWGYCASNIARFSETGSPSQAAYSV